MDNVINFLQQNKNYYPEYFEKDRLSKCNYGYTCDINQIYCYLGEKDIKETEYYSFYIISKKYFDLTNMRILDACCGKIPILSSIYNNNCLKIEAINEKIVIKNYKNIKTYEKNILQFNKYDKFDLVIAFRPCYPTETIVNDCVKNNINFMIYLCPCIHQGINSKSNFNTYEEWINYLKSKLSQFKNYNIEFIVDKNMPDKCPIIVGKKFD